MGHDDTPLQNSHTVQDFIVREMRSGFRDMHKRIDGYQRETAQNNADLKAHISNCDRRYEQLLKARNNNDPTPLRTEAITRKNVVSLVGGWMLGRFIEQGFTWLVITCVLAILYSITHGFHFFTP